MLVSSLAIVIAAGSVTDVITAASTAVLGVFGAFFTIWQFRAQGFRPKCIVKIDIRREALLVHIENRGRAEGVIARVVVIEVSGLAIEAPVAVDGFPNGYVPTKLPGLASMRLIIAHPTGMTEFPAGIKVKIDWGTGEAIQAPVPVDVGYLGMPSVLPPGTTP